MQSISAYDHSRGSGIFIAIFLLGCESRCSSSQSAFVVLLQSPALPVRYLALFHITGFSFKQPILKKTYSKITMSQNCQTVTNNQVCISKCKKTSLNNTTRHTVYTILHAICCNRICLLNMTTLYVLSQHLNLPLLAHILYRPAGHGNAFECRARFSIQLHCTVLTGCAPQCVCVPVSVYVCVSVCVLYMVRGA